MFRYLRVTVLANAYYGAIPGPANDIRGAVLVQALGDQRATTFEANQQKATELGDALDKVCSGQNTLFENRDKLDSATVAAVLKGYGAEIQSAATLIK